MLQQRIIYDDAREEEFNFPEPIGGFDAHEFIADTGTRHVNAPRS